MLIEPRLHGSMRNIRRPSLLVPCGFFSHNPGASAPTLRHGPRRGSRPVRADAPICG